MLKDTDTFQLTLRPTILTEEFPGALEYVEFNAQPTPDVLACFPDVKWPARCSFQNIGDFTGLFSKIMPPLEAAETLKRLQAGETVTIPQTVTYLKLISLAFNFSGVDPNFITGRFRAAGD